MKKLKTFLFVGAVIVLLYGCGGINLDSPEATFATLVNAIQAKDLDTYAECVYGGTNSYHVRKLKEDPTAWDGLQGFYKPTSKLVNRSESNKDGKLIATYQVDPPLNFSGVRVTVSFVQDGAEWKML